MTFFELDRNWDWKFLISEPLVVVHQSADAPLGSRDAVLKPSGPAGPKTEAQPAGLFAGPKLKMLG